VANLFDSANAPQGEPFEIVAGDFVQWKREDLTTDYPSSDYTLRYSARLQGSGGTETEITGGTDHLVQIQSSTTSIYTPGTYSWQGYIVRNSDSERVLVSQGTWNVHPNRDVSTEDPRSHAEIMLKKIESVLEGRADSDVDSYSIAGRSLTKLKPKELIDWRNYYRSEVSKIRAKLDIRNGKASQTTMKVRFP
jgi:hypothetical protein